MKTTKYVAIVATKSNFKNCNYRELPVVEFLGVLVSCLVPHFGYTKEGEAHGDLVTADFHLKEVLSIREKK